MINLAQALTSLNLFPVSVVLLLLLKLAPCREVDSPLLCASQISVKKQFVIRKQIELHCNDPNVNVIKNNCQYYKQDGLHKIATSHIQIIKKHNVRQDLDKKNKLCILVYFSLQRWLQCRGRNLSQVQSLRLLFKDQDFFCSGKNDRSNLLGGVYLTKNHFLWSYEKQQSKRDVQHTLR